MIADIQQFTMLNSQSVWLIMVGIILLSYLLEDVAIVTSASLAAQGELSVPMAFIAIMFGIITGDLALYGLGKYAKTSRWLTYKALTNKYFKTLRIRLHKAAFFNIFLIRFIPGLRTVGFTLSGFFDIPISIFLSSVVAATSLWSCLVFTVIYFLGTSVWLQVAHYQWLLIPVSVVVLLIINRLVNRSFSRLLS